MTSTSDNVNIIQSATSTFEDPSVNPVDPIVEDQIKYCLL